MNDDLAAENAQLRARIEELTDRVIAAETNNVDAADLQRENDDLRRMLADAPTTEAAIAKLREWVPNYDAGASFVAMPVATARKLLARIDEASRVVGGESGATIVPSEYFDQLMEDGPAAPNQPTRDAAARLDQVVERR